MRRGTTRPPCPRNLNLFLAISSLGIGLNELDTASSVAGIFRGPCHQTGSFASFAPMQVGYAYCGCQPVDDARVVLDGQWTLNLESSNSVFH